MEMYLWAFVNEKKNNCAKLLSITEFAYNNANNTSIGYILLKLNYGYHLYVSYEEDIDPRPK